MLKNNSTHSPFSGYSPSIKQEFPATGQTQGPPPGQTHITVRHDLQQLIVQEENMIPCEVVWEGQSDSVAMSEGTNQD